MYSGGAHSEIAALHHRKMLGLSPPNFLFLVLTPMAAICDVVLIVDRCILKIPKIPTGSMRPGIHESSNFYKTLHLMLLHELLFFQICVLNGRRQPRALKESCIKDGGIKDRLYLLVLLPQRALCSSGTNLMEIPAQRISS